MTDNDIKISSDFQDKRFSFFADPRKTENECPRTFAHLAANSHTKPTHEGSQKSKSANPHMIFILQIYCQIKTKIKWNENLNKHFPEVEMS